MIPIGFTLLFSNIILACISPLLPFQGDLMRLCLDCQLLGALILACCYCGYGNLRAKTVLYMLCWWRWSVLIINASCVSEVINTYGMVMLTTFYLVWLYRMRLPEIKSREPKEGEAFYVLRPISTPKGLFQAVFLPWYPARYETRMISDGEWIWHIHHGIFTKRRVEDTDLDKIECVKVPIGRQLSRAEIVRLEVLMGCRARLGKDCRKLLVA